MNFNPELFMLFMMLKDLVRLQERQEQIGSPELLLGLVTRKPLCLISLKSI